RLDGLKLPAWMAERMERGDAYGSVVVLARGVTPAQLFEGPDDGKPLWLEYLRNGGRIVSAGGVPLGASESPLVQPDKAHANSDIRGMKLLNLGHSWSSPYCGQNVPVALTAAARQWGIETMSSSWVGMPVENVSLAFTEFTVQLNGKQGASDWFRNVRPDMPWSGLVRLLFEFDGNNDTALRSIWRVAHYVGKPVTVPSIPPVVLPVPPKMRIFTTAGGMDGRHEFVRGEAVKIRVAADADLQATDIRLEMLQDGKALFSQTQSATNAQFLLDTAPFADSAYSLRATALQGDQAVDAQSEAIGIRYLPPEHFNLEVLYDPGKNPWRLDVETADIRDAGMEPMITVLETATVDAAVRNHVGFSLRLNAPRGDQVGNRKVTFEKNSEYFRIGPDGKPMTDTGYSGGRPMLGLSHPEIREDGAKTMERGVQEAAALPSFRPYVVCNDDFSTSYGWDYAPHVLSAFKADTGLEAPRKMELPQKCGAIPDNNPWVKWFEWTLINVCGAYNKAETEGALRARSDARIGPIPGGMMIPLVVLWQPNQYPPYNFGKNGFNLISSYYYNQYWQPVMTATFWMEIGRMGNRDLPEWNMPDVCFGTAGYVRNNLFHYLAGGVRGLAYFRHAFRNADSWSEMHRLGKVVGRIGPVQARLAPAKRDIGLLNSFTSGCFDPGHTLVQVFAYHNLMQGHFSVEPVNEDEIVAGRADRYKAVLLYNIKYLRQSVCDALAAHAAKGGLVLLDASIPFDIPGAKRLAVDVGMGEQKTLPFPAEGAHVSVPGRLDYGFEDRIALIKRALSVYIQPRFESDDIRLVASSLEADGVPYTWFVNAQNKREYDFTRDRICNYPKPRTSQSMQEVMDWETAEEAKGAYASAITMNSLPGVPYDLIRGKEIPVTQTAEKRFVLTVGMERFGGALVAWLPERIESMSLDVPPSVRPGEKMKASATLYGKGGFLGLGSGRKVAGALPVEFVLKDPSGREQIMSGVRATQDGVATWDWIPAVNDPVGQWTLVVNDLASSRTAERTIRLAR
ncbi:MAG: hypothetical protein PHR35_03720, partial [Kiritimatiellae bacterium]|nr:hypothetical protein [Kiritimatiellia bacterium]